MALPVPTDSTDERAHRGQLARAILAIQRLILPRSDDGATTVLSARSPTSSYSRTVKTTGIAQSSTTDVFTFRDIVGNVIGLNAVSGFFHVNIVDEATGANAYSQIASYVATGNGASDFVLASVSAVARGTALISTYVVAADGAGGAAKLQLVTPASGKTVTATVTFIGQVR